ncbi:MAG: extensin family protein [Deltaproteobacteria bacterium]|nr:extensin family protein [Deltaproteobacteria bacterium]
MRGSQVLVTAGCLLVHCGGSMDGRVAVSSAEAQEPALPPTPTPPRAPEPCLVALAATGAQFEPARLTAAPAAMPGCGMREGVIVSRGPTGLEYRPPIEISCVFALTLPAIEETVRQVAATNLAEPIRLVRTMGSYGCRTIRSTRSPGRLSQHALGNAIDVGILEGASVHASVVRDFRADTSEGRFLRDLAAALRQAGSLERVLDPEYDAAHRNHFHLEGHPLAEAN